MKIATLLALTLCAFPVQFLRADEKADAKEKTADAKSEEKAEVAIPEVDAKDLDALRAQLGKVARVTGYIVSTKELDSKKGQMNFLNFDGKRFTLVCFPDAMASFPDGAPAKTYDKKQIAVTGKIEEYQGALQIILTSPSQIEVLEKDSKKGDKDDAKDAGDKKDKEKE